MRSLRWISLDQSRAINFPTGHKLHVICKTRGLDCSSIEINGHEGHDPAALHFIHIKDQIKPRILLYFHGGTYVHPIDIRGQAPFALDCGHAVGASDLVCLEYTLAPELKISRTVSASGERSQPFAYYLSSFPDSTRW